MNTMIIITIVISCRLMIIHTRTAESIERPSIYELLKNPQSGKQLCLHLQESNVNILTSRSAIECCTLCEGLKIYNAVNFYSEDQTCAMLNVVIEYDAIRKATQAESICQSYMKTEAISEIIKITTTLITTTTLETTTPLLTTKTTTSITTTTLPLTTTTLAITTTTLPLKTTTRAITTTTFPITTTRIRMTTTATTQTTTTQCVMMPSYPYINSSMCEFPFTYAGILYHKCANPLPPLDNPCNKYFCLTRTRDVSICINPFDYFATNITTTISIPSFPPVTVTSVNKWITVQQRIDNTVTFDRNWLAYKNGFGVYNGNFWLGLEKLYQLTSSGSYRLRFQVLVSGEWLTDEYEQFVIDSEALGYAIRSYNYIGDNVDILNMPPLGGSVRSQNGMKFATPDRLDRYSCAQIYRCGNWFNNCYAQNINTDLTGQFLYTTKKANYWTPMTYSRIMIKSTNA